jgi:hypothetical protein
MTEDRIDNKRLKRKHESLDESNTSHQPRREKRAISQIMKESSSSKGLMELPPELIMKILDSLADSDLRSLRYCSMTCKLLRTMVCKTTLPLRYLLLEASPTSLASSYCPLTSACL